MKLKAELQLQLLMLVAVIVMNCAAYPDLELVKICRGDPEHVACLSRGSVPTLDGSLSTATNSDEVKDNADDDVGLRRSVHRAGTVKVVDRGRPTESKDFGRHRRRRSLRPTETVELAETSTGQLLTLGTDYAERFAFKDPAPHQLDISAVMGNVLLRDRHRLDYETEPEIEFVVIVTRVDDVACKYITFFLPWYAVHPKTTVKLRLHQIHVSGYKYPGRATSIRLRVDAHQSRVTREPI